MCILSGVDIIYDLVLCPDCEDKTSISATMTPRTPSAPSPAPQRCVLRCLEVSAGRRGEGGVGSAGLGGGGGSGEGARGVGSEG